jgi:hypothetical protein
MKSFSTAAKATAHEKDLPIGPDVPFQMEDAQDRTFTAATPTGPQLALFLAAFGDTADLSTRVVDTLNFFTSRFNREDAAYFKRRLNDPDDVFDFEMMSEILSFLIEEWSGRPTISPSDSAQWPTSTGNGSTAGPQDAELTHSAFGLTGS